jgi:O-antigen ligase
VAQDLPWKKIIGALTGLLFTLLAIYLLDILPNKWSGTIMAAYFFVAVAIIIGDLKRSLFFLLIVGMPLNMEFMVISRGQWLMNGAYLSLCDIAVLGLIVLGALKLEGEGDPADFRIQLCPKTTKPALLFLAVSVLSLFVSTDKTWSVFGIIDHMKLFLAYLVVANALKTKRELEYVMSFLVLSLFIQSAAYIFQCYTGVDFDIVGNPQISGFSRGLFRPRGFMRQSNTAGTFFAASLILTMSLYSLKRKISVKILIIVVFVLGVWALIFTFSRGGWSSFLLAGIVFLMIGISQGWMRVRVVAVLSIGVILFLSVFWDSINLRLTYDLAAKSRISTMEVAWKIIRDHPLLGVGVNAYKDVYDRYITEDLRSEGAMSIVHNQYLLVWTEMGVIGLFSFLWFILAFFIETKKSMTSRNNSERILATGIMSSFLAICVAMMTQPANSGTVPMLTWFLAGYIAAVRRVFRDRSSGEALSELLLQKKISESRYHLFENDR